MLTSDISYLGGNGLTLGGFALPAGWSPGPNPGWGGGGTLTAGALPNANYTGQGNAGGGALNPGNSGGLAANAQPASTIFGGGSPATSPWASQPTQTSGASLLGQPVLGGSAASGLPNTNVTGQGSGSAGGGSSSASSQWNPLISWLMGQLGIKPGQSGQSSSGLFGGFGQSPGGTFSPFGSGVYGR